MLQQIKSVKFNGINKKIILPVFLGIFVFILAYYLGINQNTNKDWDNCFRPGSIYLITGRNPHDLANCSYVTWTLLPLIPIAFLPANIGRALLASVAIVVYYLVSKKIGASSLVAALMVVNPFYLMHNIINPNVDWLVALGYILPPQIGLFFCLVKPQLSIGLILFWLIETYRAGGIKRVISTFTPVIILFGLTLIIYGPYFKTFISLVNHPSWSLSIWPYSIIIGAPLLIWSIVKRNSGSAILSGPFFSPYVGYYSWPIALLGLLPRHQVIAAAISVVIFIFLTISGIFLATL